MPSKPRRLRFLLDEHYPHRLAAELTNAGWDSVSVVASAQLRGADDQRVLAFGAAERRIVVTEDVTTFSAAMPSVPNHTGVIFCHPARFPRSPSGLVLLRIALEALAADPPPGLGNGPLVWWLDHRGSG